MEKCMAFFAKRIFHGRNSLKDASDEYPIEYPAMDAQFV